MTSRQLLDDLTAQDTAATDCVSFRDAQNVHRDRHGSVLLTVVDGDVPFLGAIRAHETSISAQRKFSVGTDHVQSW